MTFDPAFKQKLRTVAALLICAVLFLSALGLPALGEEAGTPAVNRQLLVVPFHNSALDKADPEMFVLNQLGYAFNVLLDKPVYTGVYLLSDRNASFVEDLLFPVGNDLLAPVLNELMKAAKPMNANLMENNISLTLDRVLAKAQNGRPTTVVLLQAQDVSDPNHIQWQKLRELLSLSNVELYILSLEGAETATLQNGILSLSPAEELDANLAFANAPAGEWVRLAPNAKAALISLNDLDMAQDLFADAMLLEDPLVPINELVQKDGFAQVELPRLGLSKVHLALSQVDPELALIVVNERNEVLAQEELASDAHGHKLIKVEGAAGVIRIYQALPGEQPWLVQSMGEASADIGAQAGEPVQTDTAQPETPVLTGTDIPQEAPATDNSNFLADGQNQTPTPDASPDLENSMTNTEPPDQSQPEATEPAVSEQPPDETTAQEETAQIPPPVAQGRAYFDFTLTDQLVLTPEKSSLNKKDPNLLRATVLGPALLELYQQEGLVEVEVVIDSTQGEETSYPMAWNAQSQAFEYTDAQAHAGIAYARARARVGSYFTIESPPVGYEIINQEPIGFDQPLELWVDNPFDERQAYSIDPTRFFTDADQDDLTFSLIDADTQTATNSLLVPGVAEFSIKEGQIIFVPQIPPARPTPEEQTAPEAILVPEASIAPVDTPLPEVSTAPEATMTTETDLNAEANQVPETSPDTVVSQDAESFQVSEATLAPETAQVPETSPAGEASATPEISESAKGSSPPEASEEAEVASSLEVSSTPEPSQAAQGTLLPLGRYTLMIEARDENDAARANVDLTWFSVYVELQRFSLGTPAFSPEDYTKGTSVQLLAPVNIPAGILPEHQDLFIQNARAEVVIKSGESELVRIPMDYEHEHKRYMARESYKLPNTEFSLAWEVQVVLTPANAERWQSIRLSAEGAPLQIINQQPVVKDGVAPLPDAEMRKPADSTDRNAPENVVVTVDLAEYFTDPDNSVDGENQDIVYGLLIPDSKQPNQAYLLSEMPVVPQAQPAARSEAEEAVAEETAEQPESQEVEAMAVAEESQQPPATVEEDTAIVSEETGEPSTEQAVTGEFVVEESPVQTAAQEETGEFVLEETLVQTAAQEETGEAFVEVTPVQPTAQTETGEVIVEETPEQAAVHEETVDTVKEEAQIDEEMLAFRILPGTGSAEREALPFTFTEISGVSKIQLQFTQKGQYELIVQAMDPDERNAGRVFKLIEAKEDVPGDLEASEIKTQAILPLRVTSQWENQLRLAILAYLGFLLLIVLVAILIHALKPSFAGKALLVHAASDRMFPVQKLVPLAAWRKRRVPLNWILLNCGIPLHDDMRDITENCLLVPHRKGALLINKSKLDCWEFEGQVARKRMILKIGEGDARARQGQTELSLKLATEQDRA